MFTKKATMSSPDGKRTIKIPSTDKRLSERQLKKILKKAGISKAEFLKAVKEGKLEEVKETQWYACDLCNKVFEIPNKKFKIEYATDADGKKQPMCPYCGW